MKEENSLSRLDFLKVSAIGAGAVVLPNAVKAAISPSAPKKSNKPANQVNIGFIGLGRKSLNLLTVFDIIPEVEIIAGCDVYDVKTIRFANRVKQSYEKRNKKQPKYTTYKDYKEMLANPEIDAVVIATPDHWHAIMGIDACKAGKDIYMEKPLTLTIPEGRALINAVRQNCTIMQVGSQQRSSREFIHAANLVREGMLGKILKISVSVGEGPIPYNLPEESVPEGLDWNAWLGPLPTKFTYNSRLNPPITLDPEKNETHWAAWRKYIGMGGGFTTDWGAHMFDIAQWMLGKDLTVPVKIIPPGYSHYKNLTYIYDNGIELVEEQVNGTHQCVKVYGEKGWVYVERGTFNCSNPEWSIENTPKPTVSHYQAFINAVNSRIEPNVPVEIGHSSCTMCILGNIAYQLGRPIEWNPIVEKFVDDPEATKLLSYKFRDGYSL